MPVRLFVGNLPYDTTEAELRDHFSAVGPLTYVYLPTDRETGKPRGFAFLEFQEKAQADEAIRRFNSQPFKGRPIAVNEARAKEDRPRTGGPSFQSPRPASPISRPSFGGPPPAPDARPGGHNFGPDAPPRRNRSKPRGGQKSDRPPKGPMREVVSSRFFGGDDDESYDDDFGGENFASRVSDPENEDEA